MVVPGGRGGGMKGSWHPVSRNAGVVEDAAKTSAMNRTHPYPIKNDLVQILPNAEVEKYCSSCRFKLQT